VSDATIVEILLGVLALMIGVGSFVASGRAAKVQAIGLQADVESDAYERAKGIYEGGIAQLEAQLGRLREDVAMLEQDQARLRAANRDMATEMGVLRAENAQLKAELSDLRNGSSH
jgi:cell division protein FtsB